MNAKRQGRKDRSDKKWSLLVLLKEVFRKNSNTLVSSIESVVGSGWSEALIGGVTVSMMKRLISKTGLHLRIALWPSSVEAKAAKKPE